MKILARCIHYVRILFHYAVHAPVYRKFCLGAQIIRPLRIQGRRYITIGRGSIIQRHTWLLAYKNDTIEPELTIGAGCAIGDFNHITAIRKVVVGNNVLTASRVYISDNTHNFENPGIPIMHQGLRCKAEVRIGDGTWLGENVCIIGASVGRNCVIGANSVVTKDIPDYSVAVGSPAKVIKKFNAATNTWEKIH